MNSLLRALRSFIRNYRHVRRLPPGKGRASIREAIFDARNAAFVETCAKHRWLFTGRRRYQRAEKFVRQGGRR